MDNRSISTQRLTYDRSGADINGVDYCYRVRTDELYNDSNGLYELTLKFQERSLVNGLILFQDEATTSDHKRKMLWSFSIYIGDSIDYRQNTICPNGPFLPDGDAL